MPLFYEIAFLPEGRTQDFSGSSASDYELEDGSFLRLHGVPVWCRNCGKITHGEDIEPLERIEQRLADLANPDSESYRDTARGLVHKETGIGDAILQKRIAEWTRRKKWRIARQSPPKCMVCGYTDIVVFPIDEAVPHPAGKGFILVQVRGFASTREHSYVFTPEGDRTTRSKSLDPEIVQRIHESDRRMYDALGPEDSTRTCRSPGCVRGAISMSVLCRKHHFEIIMTKPCPFEG